MRESLLLNETFKLKIGVDDSNTLRRVSSSQILKLSSKVTAEEWTDELIGGYDCDNASLPSMKFLFIISF